MTLTDQEKVGRYIDELRRAKHITLEQMGQDLGWSSKTFQRILRGEVDIKLPQLLALAQYLTFDFQELVQGAGLSANFVFDGERAVINNTDPKDPSKLEAVKTALRTQYRQTPMPGLLALIRLAETLQAEIRQDDVSAKRLGQEIFALFANDEKLTSFDFRMLSTIVGYVPYAQLRMLFSNLLVQRRTGSWSASDDAAEYVIDSFYINLLSSALDTRQEANVREAIALMHSRQTQNHNFYYFFYVKIGDVVATYLDGDIPGATALKDKLLAAITLFVPAPIVEAQRIELAQRWAQLEKFSAPVTD
ncbi:helix-turn-helix domain-containing protein [Lacticaseibacillus mingshuiensis]|uniref:Helix-turn-helix domain-containing protein n=1 Tax=Lacticaseibacillus mingshuiensis TaxID=2799574 RepID=A0ABW4CH30_9LACO|nr:helix-turn-helix transcriptional regulator [Lacticaseibacillus mingshuiensis]